MSKNNSFYWIWKEKKKIPYWTIFVPQAIALTVVEIVVAHFLRLCVTFESLRLIKCLKVLVEEDVASRSEANLTL